MFGLGPMPLRQKLFMTVGISLLILGTATQLILHLASGGSDWPYYAVGVAATVTMLVMVRRTPTKGDGH